MAQHEVTRTLVKSQPEVWTQCSDADSLGRHLNGSFGEIRITELEPEHAVAWEGEEVSGTVRIEPSAWGTRVTISVELADEVAELEHAAPPSEPSVEPEPEVVPEPELEPVAVSVPGRPPEEAANPPLDDAQIPRLEEESIPGFWGRVRARFRRSPEEVPPPEPLRREPEVPAQPAPEPVAQSEPAAEPEAAAESEPVAESTSGHDTEAALNAALESLGQAHHRPFSRA